MTPQQQAQQLADAGWREREAAELQRRADREKLTGKPWWDMPCRRGECPGSPGLPSSMTGCCGCHPDAQTAEDEA